MKRTDEKKAFRVALWCALAAPRMKMERGDRQRQRRRRPVKHCGVRLLSIGRNIFGKVIWRCARCGWTWPNNTTVHRGRRVIHSTGAGAVIIVRRAGVIIRRRRQGPAP
jgi:hypothetical protein